MRIPARWATVALVVVVLILAAYPAVGRSDGIFGRAQQGCGGMGCHVGGSDGNVQVTIGTPEAWQHDRTYRINVTLTGSLPEPPNPDNRGGFNLEVDAGRLRVPNGSETVQILEQGDNAGREATHTSSGNDQRNWTVLWDAPGNGTADVMFWVGANAVNGNGVADLTDRWTTGQADVPFGGNATSTEPEPEEPIPHQPEQVPGPGIVTVVAGLLAAVWLVVPRR